MAVFVPWLAESARMTGYPVVESPGWRTRGHGGLRAVEGVVMHHTANPNGGDYPSLRTVRDGRADLPGPLSHYGLGRSGTIYVVAAGICSHAGASAWAGFRDLNDEFLGIEAESSGVRDDWTAEQRDCYPRLCAAVLQHMRRGAERCAGHKEVALPKGRKIDPAFWDMADTRGLIAHYLDDPRRINRQWRPAPGGDEEEMAGMQTVVGDPGTDKWLVVPMGRVGESHLVPKTGKAWVHLGTPDRNAEVELFAIADRGPGERTGEYPLHQGPFALIRDDRPSWELPAGTTSVSLRYTAERPVGLSIEWTQNAG